MITFKSGELSFGHRDPSGLLAGFMEKLSEARNGPIVNNNFAIY
jgi:hypothetical protein